MKSYVVTRTGHSTSSRGKVEAKVVNFDGTDHPLEHRVRHSPDGYEFGYGGSGPADLARSILWDYFGTEPHPACYQDFKFGFVSPAPPEGFTVSTVQIDQWLAGWRRLSTNRHATLAEYEAQLWTER